MDATPDATTSALALLFASATVARRAPRLWSCSMSTLVQLTFTPFATILLLRLPQLITEVATPPLAAIYHTVARHATRRFVLVFPLTTFTFPIPIAYLPSSLDSLTLPT